MVSDKTINPHAITMSFRLFLVCSFVLLGRPQDILTFLQPLRPALVLTLLAMGAMVFGGRRQELSAALSMPESKRYMLFYLVMILGIPFASHRRVAFEGVLGEYVVNVLFFVLLVSQVNSLHRLKSLLWVLCLSTLMYGVFGGLLQSGGSGGERFQILSGGFDPNDTAYLLLSLFPLCLYFIRFDEGLLRKLVAVAAICGAIATILLTGSRGGILALGTILLILLLTKTGGVKKSHKIIVIVMLTSTWLLIGDRIDLGRYMTLSDISSDYNVSSAGGRFELWQAAIDLSFANPITGVGFGCYPFAHFFSRELAGESYLRWQTTHNSFLQVAAEIGLIGFGIFMLINLLSAFTFFRLSRIQPLPQAPETSEISALGGLMLLGFAGLLVSGFFLSQGYSIFSTLYFALAAAMGRLQAGIGSRSSKDAPEGASPA